MSNITIAEFITLVAHNDWQFKQDYEVIERFSRPVEKFNDEKQIFEQFDIPHVWGVARRISILNGIKIKHTESFLYEEYDIKSFSTGTEGIDNIWSIEGVSVIDEKGEVLDSEVLSEYLPSDFYIDYVQVVRENVMDVEEEGETDTYTLEINNAPNIRFTGEMVACVKSSPEITSSLYSGQTGYWTKLMLYKTKGGKFICYQVINTLWQGEHAYCRGQVCETLDEVKAFFGHGWLSKSLYIQAEISDTVDVE